MLVGFLLPFRLIYEGLGIVGQGSRWYFYCFHDPLFRYRFLMPPAALLLALAELALLMILATAFLLIVEHTAPKPAESGAVAA